MVKLKTAAITMLTLCLLILGALLPTFVGAIQNKHIIQSGFETVQTGNLRIKESMTLTDKLHVLANMQSYPLSRQTVQTEESLRKVVDEGLQPYIDRGLLDMNMEESSRFVNQFLAYRTDAPEVNFPVWSVNMLCGYNELKLLVDDETGLILTVQYVCTGSNPPYSTADNVSQIKDAYFESTNLSQDDWEISVSAMDKQYAEAICVKFDQNYGRIELQFSAFTTGFFTYILE